MLSDRDDLLRRVDLAALLDELSPRSATGHGTSRRWSCPAPDHDDQHPSVSMFTDRHGIPRWTCWSGGHHGTAIDALLVARGGSVADALTELRDRSAHEPAVMIGAPPQPVTRPSNPLREPDPVVIEYVQTCARRLWQPAGRPVLEYLVEQRGLAQDTLHANQVGADPGPGAVARADGLPHGGTAAVLPAFDPNGAITYVQARYLHPTDVRRKYDNPVATLATNPRLNWTAPARAGDPGHLIVCEGTIDALTAASHGTPAVAILGATHATREAAARIAEHAGPRQVIIAIDNDPAGRSATDILVTELGRLGHTPAVLRFGDGEDLNQVLLTGRLQLTGHDRYPLRHLS